MKDYYSFGHVMSSAWKIATKNWLVFIGLYLGYLVCTFIINAFSGNPIDARFITVTLVSVLFSSLFMCGYYKLYLNAANGEEPEFSVFKENAGLTFKMFLVSILSSVIRIAIALIGVVIFGFMLGAFGVSEQFMTTFTQLANNGFDTNVVSEMSGNVWLSALLSFLITIVPFIWVSIKISFAPVALVDKRCSILEAFKISFAITNKHIGTIFMLYFTGAMIMIVSLMVFIVGVLFGIIVLTAIYTEQYRALKLLHDHKDDSAEIAE